MLPHGLRDLRWLYTTLQMGRGQQQAIVTFQDRLHRPVDGSLLVVALVLAGGMIEGREGAFADRAGQALARLVAPPQIRRGGVAADVQKRASLRVCRSLVLCTGAVGHE